MVKRLNQITKNKEEEEEKNEKIPHTGDTDSLIIKGNTGSVLLSAPPNMTYGVMIIKMKVNSNNELCYTAGNWFTGLPVIQYGRQLWDPGFSVPFMHGTGINVSFLLLANMESSDQYG